MHSMTGTSEFDECLSCNCFAVRKAARAVTQHYDRSLRKSGLRATQFNTLVVLAKAGPMPMASAEFLGMDRTSLTRNLQPPARKKWIRIAPGDEDRRVRMVSITDAGGSPGRRYPLGATPKRGARNYSIGRAFV